MKIKLRSMFFPVRFAAKRTAYIAAIAAAFVFAVVGFALWRPTTFAAKPNQQPCSHCAAKSNQMIYLPLIALPEAQGSELVFNSRSPQTVDVTPTFYKLDGTAIVGKSVSIQAAEIRYVDLKKLVPGQYRNDADWGGMSLAYTGVTREMWAQLRLLGVNGGGSVDEFFSVPSEVRSDLQEAVWWMPPNSSSIIALGNITDITTSATVQFNDGQEQFVVLAPHATEIIRHIPRSRATSESVAINVTGAAGSVIPTGVIASADGSFNSVIRFHETKLAKQPNLFGNGLRLAGTEPHLVLKNTSPAPIKATPKFIPFAGSAAGGSLELPTMGIGPNQTVEVDLSAVSRAAQNRPDLNTVSVTVANSGAPGSLIGSLYANNKATGVNYDVPLRDSGPARSMTGAYPWKISDDYTTIVYLTNISDAAAEFVAQINYDGGKYVLGIRKLAAGETAVFDIKQMIADQKPDEGNRQLPDKLQLGQFKWIVRSATGGKVVLIGRAEMVSRSQRISTSYSCAENCLATHWGGITPTSMLAIVGSVHGMSAWEMGGYASGSTIGPYSASGTWSSDDTNIATITSGGSCSAVACGQTMIGFVSNFFDTYSWDGLDCVYISPSQWDADSGIMAVPQVTITEVGFKNDLKVTQWSDGHIIDDTDGTEPTWKSTGNPNYPVAYIKSQQPTMFSKFSVSPTPTTSLTAKIRVKNGGTVIATQDGISINGANVTVANISVTQSLPSVIQANSFTYTWEISFDNGVSWQDAGSSGSHKLYTVAATPQTPPFKNFNGTTYSSLYDLALSKACGYINGATGTVDASALSSLTSGISNDSQIQYNPGQLLGDVHPLKAYAQECLCADLAALLAGLVRSIGGDGQVTYIWAGPNSSTEKGYTLGSAGVSCSPGNTNSFCPTFRVSRSAKGAAPANPHFSYHATVLFNGTLYDPTYGDSYTTPSFTETALNNTPTQTSSTFPGFIQNANWTCPH